MASYRLIDNTRKGTSAIRAIDGSGDRIITSLNGEDIIKEGKDPKSGRPIRKIIKGATQEILADLYNKTEKWGASWAMVIIRIEDGPDKEVIIKKKGSRKKKAAVTK